MAKLLSTLCSEEPIGTNSPSPDRFGMGLLKSPFLIKSARQGGGWCKQFRLARIKPPRYENKPTGGSRTRRVWVLQLENDYENESQRPDSVRRDLHADK